jgi:hypothetical protein
LKISKYYIETEIESAKNGRRNLQFFNLTPSGFEYYNISFKVLLKFRKKEEFSFLSPPTKMPSITDKRKI